MSNSRGLKVNIESGTFQVGDRFLLTPTRDGARTLDLSTTRVEDIALGSPVRTEADLGNIGNAVISQGDMLAVKSQANGAVLPTWEIPGEMNPPVLIRFINDEYYQVLDNTDPARPASLNPPLDNQRYIPGIANPVFTEDAGQTALVAGYRNDGGSLAVAATTTVGQVVSGAGANGYGAQTITVQSRDPETGLLMGTTDVSIAANSTAETIANQLNGVNGVSATAFSEVKLSNFSNDNAGVSPELTITVEEIDITSGTVTQVPVSLGSSFEPNDLADAINNSSILQEHNFVAWSDESTLTVRNLTGEDIIFSMTGDGTDGVDIESEFTSAATTMAGGDSVTVGGRVDIRMDNGVSIRSDNSNIFQSSPIPVSSFTGYQVELSGTPKSGDQFTIEYNAGGVSDNRNALALLDLEAKGLIGGGVSSFNEAYSQLVENTGSVTSQAQVDSESSQALLRQSEARLQEIAGVNLDEEAGRLIQYQASYNASARVVAIARELFTTLLNTFG